MNTEILGVILQWVALVVLCYPLGRYIAKVYRGERTWLDFMAPLERGIYKVCSYLKSKVFFDYARQEATQTTIKNVSLKSMRMLPVPLPPLAEQKRIVAKIEELLPLCERLK